MEGLRASRLVVPDKRAAHNGYTSTTVAVVSKARLRFIPDYVETQKAVKRLAEDEWYRFDGEDLPQPVLLRLRELPDGRRVCTGILVGAIEDREIPARDLRRISLPVLLELVGEELARRTKERGFKDYVERPRAARLTAGTSYRPAKRPAAGWPREHFQQVALGYRANLVRHPFAPMQALARQLGTSEPTARRWVLRARDMGLLGRPAPGKAGAGDPVDEDELALEEVWVGTAGPRRKAAARPRTAKAKRGGRK